MRQALEPVTVGPDEIEDAAADFARSVQIVSPLPDHLPNSRSAHRHTFDPYADPQWNRNRSAASALCSLNMVNVADVLVGATTDQQAHAVSVAMPSGEEPPYRVEAVAEITVGSFTFVARTVTLGRSSSFLAAAGDAILGARTFGDDSADAIREARGQRR